MRKCRPGLHALYVTWMKYSVHRIFAHLGPAVVFLRYFLSSTRGDSLGNILQLTHCDVNVRNVRTLGTKWERSASLSTQCTWAAAGKLLSATRAIWLEWTSDFLFPCMKTNSRGDPLQLPLQSQSAPSHKCSLSSRRERANKTWACLRPLSKLSLYSTAIKLLAGTSIRLVALDRVL